MEALQSSPRREEIGWEADPAGFEDPQALRSRYYFRIGGSLSDIQALAPDANWLSGRRFDAGADQEEVARWVEGLR